MVSESDSPGFSEVNFYLFGVMHSNGINSNDKKGHPVGNKSFSPLSYSLSS